ncbi:MAG: efflux RND transporter permease subunit [Pseudomonadota bacterium]
MRSIENQQESYNTMMERYTTLLLRWRYVAIIITILLVIATVIGLRFLEFDQDYRVFFHQNYPQLVALEELHKTYNKNDNVLIALAPKNGNVFTRETLEVVERLTQKAWQIPYSMRVESITNFQYSRAQGDDLVVSDLVRNAMSLSSQELEQVKKVTLAEPSLRSRLISPTGHVTAINIVVELPEKSTAEAYEVVNYVRTLVSQLQKENPKLDVYLTGMVMMNNAFPEASIVDMTTLIPFMYGIIILSMILLLRSVWATVATLIIITFSVLSAVGIAAWLGIRLTPPSASTPTMIMTLAMADSIHFLTFMFREMRRGLNKHDAIRESLRVNMQPIFLTTVATVIGFLSMNFSDTPPFRDLGNITAIGVAAAFLYTVFFLPAFMAVLPLRVPQGQTWLDIGIEKVAEFVIKHRGQLLWGMSGLVLILVAFIPRIELNDQFVDYFDESFQFRHDTDFVMDNLIGIYSIEYSLKAEESGGIASPAYLQKLDEFAAWYRQQPGVMHVSTFSDVMKRINRNMHGDDPDRYQLPETRELAAQYLLLYEMSLPYGLDLNNQINVDKSATRFVVSLENLSTRDMRAIEQKAENWLHANAPAHMFSKGASPTVMFSHISETNIRSMLVGTLVALLLISLVLVFALRSLKMGLISLIPNLIPALMAFGLWGMLVGQVGLALSIVAAMTIGIVVDDTIHFLSKYIRAYRENSLSAENSVRYAFSTVGVALVVTTMILMAGFLVLSQSTFEMNSSMGLLTAITIGFALMADFLLLPAILIKLQTWFAKPTGQRA